MKLRPVIAHEFNNGDGELRVVLQVIAAKGRTEVLGSLDDEFLPKSDVRRYGHLFAAAPELLEACEEMLDCINAAHFPATMALAEKAIKKAKGEKP